MVTDRDAEIVSLIDDHGQSYGQVAKKFDVSRNVVAGVHHRHRTTIPNQLKATSPVAQKIWGNGRFYKTAKQAAELENICVPTVYWRIRNQKDDWKYA